MTDKKAPLWLSLVLILSLSSLLWWALIAGVSAIDTAIILQAIKTLITLITQLVT